MFRILLPATAMPSPWSKYPAGVWGCKTPTAISTAVPSAKLAPAASDEETK